MIQELIKMLVAAIPSIIIALISAGGFWAYVEHRYNDKRKSRGKKLDEISQDLKTITSEIAKNGDGLVKLEDKVGELSQNQMQCAVKLEKIESIETKFGNLEDLIDTLKKKTDLSVAYARDRLNHLSNKYLDQGFIPKEDIIPYKLLGQAYIDSGGNSETKTKFLHCINELPVKSKDER